MQEQYYDTLKTPLGTVQVRRSTINASSLRESVAIPSDTRAIELMGMGYHQTDENSRLYIMDMIREFNYFKAIEEQQNYFAHLEQFVKCAEFRHIKKGRFVFHSGDPGDYFYLIIRGQQCNVLVQRSDDDLKQHQKLLAKIEHLTNEIQVASASQIRSLQIDLNNLKKELHESYFDPQENLLLPYKGRYFERGIPLYRKVNQMKTGDCFGEIALFQNENRAASIIATEGLYLLAVSKANYLQIFSHKLEKLNFTLGILQKTFTQTPRDAIIQISFDLQKKTYQMCHPLYREGDPINGIFLISKGCVETSKQKMKLYTYVEGQFIGLFDNKSTTRNHTCIAMSGTTTVYFLPMKFYTKLHSSIKAKVQEMFQERDVLDKDRVQSQVGLNILRAHNNQSEPRMKKHANLPSLDLNKNSLSNGRITEIFNYNQHLHCKTDREPKNVVLCLQMKEFNQEREFQMKLNTSRSTRVFHLQRTNNFTRQYNSLFNSGDSPQGKSEQFVNIHVDRMKKKKSMQYIALYS